MSKKALTCISLVHTSTSSLSRLDSFWFICLRIIQVFKINCSFSWVGVGAQLDCKLLSSWDLFFLSQFPTLFLSWYIPSEAKTMLTQMKSKQLGKQQNLLHPSALHLPCHFHISGSEFSPLHFTSNDRQCDSPHLEEKGTFTKWTAFSGFLFSSPMIFTTQEEKMCCRSWSRRHRKGSAVVWRRGRRGRKEAWSVTARWIETNLSPQRSRRTRTDRTVLSLHVTYMLKHNDITHLTTRK